MITPLILLYRLPTFLARAMLGVGDHPIDVLRIRAILDLPFLCDCAGAWLMRVSPASETVDMATRALDFCSSVVGGLHRIDAAWLRAPSHALIIISEAFTVEFSIGSELILVIL